MALSNGIITAPVTDSDLKTLFGAGNNINDWCNNGAINKFARYKPVRLSKKELLTNADRQSVAHGITIPDVVTSTSITGAAIQDASANDWEYNLPTGGDNQKYREADFCNCEHPSSYGYYHNAVPPIQVVYPRDGWTFQRGNNQSRSLIIYVDLDPDDSAINLQSYDFVASGLDLNQWTLIAFVDSQYLSTKIFASDDTILNGGEMAGNSISITIPNGTGSYYADVYICMYRYNNSIGRYEFLPLPKQGDYNPGSYTLHVVDDAQQSGGGIPGGDTEEMFKNVSFSYGLYGTYKTAWDCTDGGTAKWSMRGGGSLYVKMTLKNTAASQSTIDRQDFELDLNGLGFVTPTTLYNSNKQSVSSVTIPSGGTIDIYMFFDAIFTGLGSDWTNSNKNSSFSMDFTRNGATLFGCDIYACRGTDGWIERSS